MAIPLVPILGLAGKILDKVIPDPEARAKAKLELQQLEMDGQLKQIQYQLSAILVEAQSNDPWTSRARPSFMYVIYIFILAALPMGVLFAFSPETADAVTDGVRNWLEALPSEMWSVFAVGYLGYTGARTFEKRKLIDKGQM